MPKMIPLVEKESVEVEVEERQGKRRIWNSDGQRNWCTSNRMIICLLIFILVLGIAQVSLLAVIGSLAYNAYDQFGEAKGKLTGMLDPIKVEVDEILVDARLQLEIAQEELGGFGRFTNRTDRDLYYLKTYCCR